MVHRFSGEPKREGISLVGSQLSCKSCLKLPLPPLNTIHKRTEWLGDQVARDAHGFILTGSDLDAQRDLGRWPLKRPPYLLEASVPGIFAAGDVRHDSVKRVASAVGEGSVSVHFIHRYLGSL